MKFVKSFAGFPLPMEHPLREYHGRPPQVQRHFSNGMASTCRPAEGAARSYDQSFTAAALHFEENAALREDLAFFQSLMAAGGHEGALSINRFRVRPEALPGEYRYRLLLVQTGQRVKEFRGKLQFVLQVEQGNRKFALTLPREGEAAIKDYQVSFKFFQRVEGTFKVAPDAVVKSLQVRVFENGSVAPKLSQTVSIS